jgi:toxin secretion/phage lysis holin
MTGVKIFIAGLGTLAASFLGGFDQALYALFIFLVLDYVTGVLAAIYTKTLSSSTGLNGIIKKVMQLILVGVAATLDSVMGLSDPYFRTAVIYFLLANEGISILENLARSDIPIPVFLKNILEQLKNKEGVTK